MSKSATGISHENFTCLTKLDENRANAQISKKLRVNVEDIQNIFIYGNHSSTMVPDFSQALVKGTKLEKCTGITKD